MSITTREVMMHTPTRNDDERALRPFWIVLGLFGALFLVLAVVTVNDAGQFHRMALPADRCPLPSSGQRLLVIVDPKDADGTQGINCQVVTSQGAVRERMAKAAQ